MLTRRATVFAGLSVPLVNIWIPSIAIAKQRASLAEKCDETTKVLCDKFGLESVSSDQYPALTVPLHRRAENAYADSYDHGFDGPVSKIVPAFKSPNNKRVMLTAKHKNHHDFVGMYGSGTRREEKMAALPTLAFIQHGHLARKLARRFSVEDTVSWLFPLDPLTYFDALISESVPASRPVRSWAKTGYWIMTAKSESRTDGAFVGHGRTTLYDREGKKAYDYIFDYDYSA